MIVAFKERVEPIILSKLRVLNKRLELSDEENRYLSNLEKGYQGELQFDALTQTLTSSCLILNELLLEVEKASFQIDTLILFADTLYIFEIKNNHGDYLYKQEGLTSLTTGASIKNPLDQLNRTKLLFKKLLHQLGYNNKLQGSVVFVNPEFTLYQAQPDLPFIFPTQIKRLLTHLNNQPGKVSTNHYKLANKLVSLHQTESPSNKLPNFHYDELKKGISCSGCESFSVTASHKFLMCDDCERRELLETAVMRTVSELMLLFPKKEITSNTIQEWCKVIGSKKKIRRILLKNFDTKGSKQWRKYQ